MSWRKDKTHTRCVCCHGMFTADQGITANDGLFRCIRDHSMMLEVLGIRPKPILLPEATSVVVDVKEEEDEVMDVEPEALDVELSAREILILEAWLDKWSRTETLYINVFPLERNEMIYDNDFLLLRGKIRRQAAAIRKIMEGVKNGKKQETKSTDGCTTPLLS